jgi:lipopolysaccharide transport system permease protein
MSNPPKNSVENPPYLRSLAADLSVVRSLGYRLALRSLASTYRDSWFGFAWLFIQPFTTSILWILLREYKILEVNVSMRDYPAFVLSGTLCWQAFCDGLLMPQRVISDNRQMLTKINVPPEGLLLAGLAETLVRLAAGSLITCLILTVHAGMLPTINWLALLIGPMMSLWVGFTTGWMIAPPALLLPDLQRFITLGLPFIMYLSPVVYDLPAGGLLHTLMSVNPLTPLLSSTRDLLLQGEWPGLQMFATPALCIILAFSVAGPLMRRALPHIIERMGT